MSLFRIEQPIVVELGRDYEYRFEVADNQYVSIKLKSGTAELYGCELAPLQEYHFTLCKKAINTWQGCELEVKGDFSRKPYVSRCDQAAVALNICADIEKYLENKGDGGIGKKNPRIMIVGPSNCGKTAFASRICNDVLRASYRPIYVNLDVGQGDFLVYGTVYANILKIPMSQHLSSMELSLPLVYFFGELSPEKNVSLYKKMITKLASDIENKMRVFGDERSAVIIDTCSWTVNEGYKLLVEIARIFRADIVNVIDDVGLKNDLTSDLEQTTCSVYGMQKAEGITVKERDFQMKRRNKRIREYYYGINGNLCPHSLVVAFSTIEMYKLSADTHVPLYALPIGHKPTIQESKLTRLNLTSDLKHLICSISSAEGEEGVLESPILGFIYISEVDIEHGELTILAPCPGSLPNNIIMASSLRWIE